MPFTGQLSLVMSMIGMKREVGLTEGYRHDRNSAGEAAGVLGWRRAISSSARSVESLLTTKFPSALHVPADQAELK
ncbi:hypothetical protein OsI_25867 [Oryza sativa Indica Group]|uniref:Uncharacterized protein n=1 Tax=Oryza sativa subsp. indica TaxID=39946 RepID=A2YKX6_ORYSI|nr:hypothetical protein OsI_25867 [Oryza sativa Indica Group]